MRQNLNGTVIELKLIKLWPLQPAIVQECIHMYSGTSTISVKDNFSAKNTPESFSFVGRFLLVCMMENIYWGGGGGGGRKKKLGPSKMQSTERLDSVDQS